MNPNYHCPECRGDLRLFGGKADYECTRCGVLIRERDDAVYVEFSPDEHASREQVYSRNHIENGMNHEQR